MASLSAKERRKIRREEKKKFLMEREEMLKKMGADVLPPSERIGVCGVSYKGSTEADWDFKDPVWVHKQEVGYFDSYYRQCCVTKKFFRTSNMIHDWNGNFYNVEDAKKLLLKCEYSGNWALKDDLEEVFLDGNKKGLVLKEHIKCDFRKCDYTGRMYPSGRTLIIKGSEKYKRVGRHLIDGKHFNQCNDCHGYFEAAMVPSRPDLGRFLCQSCYDTRIMGKIIHVHNYDKYPAPIYTPMVIKRMVGGKLQKDASGFSFYVGKRELQTMPDPALRLFGCEAETEIFRKGAEKDGLNRVKLAHNVIKTLGDDFVIIKEDGTLTANDHYSKGTGFSGFEIVSAPADLSVHRDRWPRLHEMAGFKHLRAWDEYDTCGFHVHVTKEALTWLQISKMVYFINHKSNQKFIFKVAGRGSDRFCKYIPKNPSDGSYPEKVVNTDEDDRRNRSRRVALNIANPKTVEFRIFRGTVHPRHIIRNLEFCDAVCDFCYPASRSVKEMEDYKYFIDFVNKRRKQYPLFAEWLANQKIIELKEAKARADMDKRTLKPELVAEAAREQKQTSKKSLLIAAGSAEEEAPW